MKSQIERIMREALESAEDCMAWTREGLERLRKDNGDPKKIEQYERWHADATETAIQIREFMVGDSAAPSQPAKDKMLALIKRVAGLDGTLAVTTEARQLLKKLSASVVGKP
jgi:hypothetical protein